MKLPLDIVHAINSNLPDEQSRLELKELCKEIFQANINVGHEQLIRSLLVISK